MSLTPSTMLELGTHSIDFTLPTGQKEMYSLNERPLDKGTLLVFMCNHCPYVIHILKKLVESIAEYQKMGLEVVAINSNDFQQYQDDSPVKMVEMAKKFNFSFPYLVDEDQEVAKAYRAACTPDFFLFNGERKLVYRGQFDGARPGNTIPVSGEDLSKAVKDMVAGKPISKEQKPSMGCNIKWKKGGAPEYFTS